MVRSRVGAPMGCARRGKRQGTQASVKAAMSGASARRGAASRNHPPPRDEAEAEDGGSPSAQRYSNRLVKGGAKGVPAGGKSGHISGGATAGRVPSASVRLGRGVAKAANASAQSCPPCRRRAESVVTERPARSTVA